MRQPRPIPVRTLSVGHLVVLAGVIGAIAFAARADFIALDFDGVSLGAVGTLLAVFVFVSLLIERAVEMILGFRYGAEEIAILTPLRQAATRNRTQAEMLARDLDLLVSPQDRMTLIDDTLQADVVAARRSLSAMAGDTRVRLEDVRRQKKRVAAVCSCILGVGVSLSGFQLLHGLFASETAWEALPRLQCEIFYAVDTVVTAVVLAGGADGIHQILRATLKLGENSRMSILKDG
ncbi:MAG: hypothetical protein KDA73_07335 [Rhodobacteraceae bacterium]|nr:hypothetical protein [Paracoccaceae bacterium]